VISGSHEIEPCITIGYMCQHVTISQ